MVNLINILALFFTMFVLFSCYEGSYVLLSKTNTQYSSIKRFLVTGCLLIFLEILNVCFIKYYFLSKVLNNTNSKIEDFIFYGLYLFEFFCACNFTFFVIFDYASLIFENKKFEPYLTVAIILIIVFGKFEFLFKLKNFKLKFLDFITIKNGFYETLSEYFNNNGFVKTKFNTYFGYLLIFILIIYVLFGGKKKKTNSSNSEIHNYVNKYSNEWTKLLAKYHVTEEFEDRLKFSYFIYLCAKKPEAVSNPDVFNPDDWSMEFVKDFYLTNNINITNLNNGYCSKKDLAELLSTICVITEMYLEAKNTTLS